MDYRQANQVCRDGDRHTNTEQQRCDPSKRACYVV